MEQSLYNTDFNGIELIFYRNGSYFTFNCNFHFAY
jgi:hypothetical protein